MKTQHKSQIIQCRDKRLEVGSKTLIMGILNVTPDSFSDGAKYMKPELALQRAFQMIEEGADIIDLGGVSTRPNYSEVSEEEELTRIMPVLEKLIANVQVPISVDTWRTEIAEKALKMGAHIINDQKALLDNNRMVQVISNYNALIILMHNEDIDKNNDIMDEIIKSLRKSIKKAQNAGIPITNIIIDPGIGFKKTYEQNLEVLDRLNELKILNCPILLGISRKSVIGKTLALPVDQRIEGTAATVALGIDKGADIVRIHDVKEMVRVAKMTDAIVRREK